MFPIRKCLRPRCGFRYHVTPDQANHTNCPKCGGPTQFIENPYRNLLAPEPAVPVPGPRVEVLLDNLRSSENVGAIFRSADGAGVTHLHLCGTTPTPDLPKVAKTALGAEFNIPWTQHWDAVEAASKVRARGALIWVLEGGEQSVSLFDPVLQIPPTPVLLVLGSEVAGVDPGLLDICDQRISIPMAGIKRSLNVAVAFGIAIYTIRFGAAFLRA